MRELWIHYKREQDCKKTCVLDGNNVLKTMRP